MRKKSEVQAAAEHLEKELVKAGLTSDQQQVVILSLRSFVNEIVRIETKDAKQQ